MQDKNTKKSHFMSITILFEIIEKSRVKNYFFELFFKNELFR